VLHLKKNWKANVWTQQILQQQIKIIFTVFNNKLILRIVILNDYKNNFDYIRTISAL
jgi:hypothetical protein